MVHTTSMGPIVLYMKRPGYIKGLVSEFCFVPIFVFVLLCFVYVNVLGFWVLGVCEH